MMEEAEQCRVTNEPPQKKKISTSPFFLSLPCLLMNEIKGQSEAAEAAEGHLSGGSGGVGTGKSQSDSHGS